MPKPFIVRPDNAPRPLNIVGEQLTVLASRDQTGGYEIFHQVGPAGSGPPPHSHPWDESFYVVTGRIAFGIDAESFVAAPGTLVHLPAGTTHWFRFEDAGEMISMTSAGEASRMFTDFDREISPTAPSLAELMAVGARHGLTVAAD